MEALALDAADLGLAAFSATAFNLAGSGKIKAIAAQVREQRGYEGNEIVASTKAYARGLHGLADLANKSIALSELGGTFHYQLALIAQRQGFDLDAVTLKPLHSFDAVARAVAGGDVDAAILPPLYARELLAAGRARPVGWYSALDGAQLGALFASAKTLQRRRPMLEKFLRAYRRGAAAYAEALLRHDSYGKRVIDGKTRAAAAAIGLYLYPGHARERHGAAGGGRRLFHGRAGATRSRRPRAPDRLVQGAGADRQKIDAHAMVETNDIAGRRD